MAMAIATTVINILKAAPLETQMLLIAIGLACLAIISLDQEKDEE